MAKVCIIALANIKHISLISLYTEYLQKHGIGYDLIYIDRYGIAERTGAENSYAFRSRPAASRLGKLGSFLRFRRFALKHIRENRYDRLILWQSNTAYLFFDVLIREFSGRYVVNIRDYIMENQPIIRHILKKLKDHAAFVTISSPGFLEFLPQGEYIRVNSVNESLLGCTDNFERPDAPPYKIGFVGNCRFYRENYRIMDRLKNDPRFELWYCGTGSEALADYARQHHIENVFTTPGFAPEETLSIMSRFHMINSAFGADAMDNRTLMPIRLYTAVDMGLPVLASEGSFLAAQIRECGLGYAIDSESDFADGLYEYLHDLDQNRMRDNCRRYMEQARQENLEFEKRLSRLLGV